MSQMVIHVVSCERRRLPLHPRYRTFFGVAANGRNGGVEDRRGSLGPIGQRPVSYPRSSNWTCRFPASSSPTGFTERHTEKKPGRKRVLRQISPSPFDTAVSDGSCH